MRLGLLRWENHPELLCWAQCNHKSPHKKSWSYDRRVSDREGDVTMEGEGGSCREGAMSPGLQADSRRWKRQREEVSLGASGRDTPLLTP